MSSKLILRRIGLGILTLWLVSLVVFAAVIALPGDAATAILGKEATPDRVAALRDQLHLNESVVTQYTQWPRASSRSTWATPPPRSSR